MHVGYTSSISRGTPGLLLFLLDMSASMGEEFEFGMRRADFLADVLNRTLKEVSAACRRREGVLHYFDIGIVVYNGTRVASGFGGDLAGRSVVGIPQVAESPIEIAQRKRKQPNEVGELIEVAVAFPIWFKPQVGGGTPMCQAFRHAAGMANEWCKAHPNSFPPIVMHITDGEASDGDPAEVEAAARLVTSERTADGHALLLNLHIASGGGEVRYPTTEASLPPHPFAKALFRASSALAPPLLARAFQQKLPVQPGSRGYVYNGRMEDMLAFLDLGTKAATDLVRAGAADR